MYTDLFSSFGFLLGLVVVVASHLNTLGLILGILGENGVLNQGSAKYKILSKYGLSETVCTCTFLYEVQSTIGHDARPIVLCIMYEDKESFFYTFLYLYFAESCFE